MPSDPTFRRNQAVKAALGLPDNLRGGLFALTAGLENSVFHAASASEGVLLVELVEPAEDLPQDALESLKSFSGCEGSAPF